MIGFYCPNCQFVQSAPPESAGSIIKCRRCGQKVVVPQPAQGGGGSLKRAIFFLFAGLVFVSCAALIGYSFIRLQSLATEQAVLEKAKSELKDQIDANEKQLKRAIDLETAADEKLAQAETKEKAAAEAPRRAEEERKLAEQTLKDNKLTLAETAEKQKQAQESEREAKKERAAAIDAKAEAEKLLAADGLAKKEIAALKQAADEKETKAAKAASDAKTRLEKAQDTLLRVETNPGIAALLQKMKSKTSTERKDAATIFKSLGPGLYPERFTGQLCEAVAIEKDKATAKTFLEALAFVDPEVSPAVVSLMLDVTRKDGVFDFDPWKGALKQITTLKRGGTAPIMRLRLQNLTPFLDQPEAGSMALEMVNFLAELQPDDASVAAISKLLATNTKSSDFQDGCLAALVAIYPKSKAAVCDTFGEIAKRKQTSQEFLIKLAKAAVELKDARLVSALAPLRFHNSPEVREAAEAVFRLEK